MLKDFFRINLMTFGFSFDLFIIFLVFTNSFQFNIIKNRNIKNMVKMSASKESLKEVVDLMKDSNKYSPYGLLSTINYSSNIQGYPFVSLSGFVVSDNGFPIFCLSSMSRHTKNLNKNESTFKSKGSLYIREQDALWDKQVVSKKRVTFTGNINKINIDSQDKNSNWKEIEETYKELYKKIHPDAFWVDFPDFEMYRMDFIKDIYYVGGFSKATKISTEKYLKEFNSSN